MLKAIWGILGRRNVFGAGLPLLVGAGLTMIYGGDFTYGLIVIILAGLWSVAFWLESDLVKKKKPTRKPRPRKNEDQEATSQAKFRGLLLKYRCWQTGGVITIAILCFVAISFTNGKAKEHELQKLGGILYPSDKPTPMISCLESPRPEATNVFFDNSVSVISKFPHTIISVNQSPRLAIDKRPDGSIGIRAHLVSSDGRVIAEIQDDKFIVNPNNYLEMKRSDKSNLLVRDQYGFTVLDVTYLNPKAVMVSSLVVYTSTGDRMELAASQGPPRMCFDKGLERSPNIGDLDLSREQPK